jgi:A/G-specific adenine glycosylase
LKKNSHPIAKSLIHWYSGAKRDLPWRGTKDPYRIWLSEIILQQTRVDQGLPYYEAFIDAFPTIHDLAAAPEDKVLRLWQGLGYYSRARNLHHTAKNLVNEFGGVFPDSSSGLLKLKGIGPYTAAAIASIAFDEPVPVVDGNVFRVTSRLFGVKTDIQSSTAHKVFAKILQDILPAESPGEFNQAIMEFGAKVCTPAPNCKECVVREHCYARQTSQTSNFPVKSKKAPVRDRYLNYLVVRSRSSVLIKKREGSDIWKGLYDFPLVEGKSAILPSLAMFECTKEFRHLLSHQRLHVQFAEYIPLSESRLSELAKEWNVRKVSRKTLLTLPVPKVIANYLAQANL